MTRPPARTDDPPSVVAARQLAEEAGRAPGRRPDRRRRRARPRWDAAGRADDVPDVPPTSPAAP